MLQVSQVIDGNNLTCFTSQWWKTKVKAMKHDARTDDVTMKRDEMYFVEDIRVDPIGKAGLGPVGPTIGAEYARKGWYGFALPKNSKGYELLLVPASAVEVK